jgi:hypothetical protein
MKNDLNADLEDFRQSIISHAKLCVENSRHVNTEHGTKAVLIQPFLNILGYNVSNPREIYFEHRMDFSERNKNKADYAIIINEHPVIAIEDKCINRNIKEDVGQLRGYFNACSTVKLGILTNGLKYEFYVDSDRPNMMDDAPYLNFDLKKIAEDKSIDNATLSGIASIRKTTFNPDNVGSKARETILINSIVETMKNEKENPTTQFVRFILQYPDIRRALSIGEGSNLTQRIIEDNKSIVKQALKIFVDKEVLANFGYAPKDVIKTSEEVIETPVSPAPVSDENQDVADKADNILYYTKMRLAYLVKDEILLEEIKKLQVSKNNSSCRVFYKRSTNGSIFNFFYANNEIKFHCLNGKTIILDSAFTGYKSNNLYVTPKNLDENLLESFKIRVSELANVR